jgi:hypothetical protein
VHRPILLAVTCLLGVATIAVTAVAASIPREPIAADPASTNREIVLQYYNAINAQIATGDATALRKLLHPSYRDQSPSEAQALESLVDRLHRIAPEIRLIPEPLAANGGEVIAHVQVNLDRSPAALGFQVDDPSTLWPRFETFRVADDLIAERKGSSLGLVSLQGVDALEINLDHRAARLLTADHSLYSPGVWRSFTTKGGPALLLITSGELLVTMPPKVAPHARLYSLSAGANHGIGEGIPIGHELVLTADTAILIPMGTVFTVRNQGAETATALEGLLVAPSKGYPVNLRPSDDDSTAKRAPGLTVTPLLIISKDELADKDRLSVGILTLMPGARIPIAATAGPMILLYETGSLHVKAVGKPVIHYEGSCDGDTKTPSQSSELLCSMVIAEPSGAVVNVGDTPMTARVIVLERQLVP